MNQILTFFNGFWYYVMDISFHIFYGIAFYILLHSLKQNAYCYTFLNSTVDIIYGYSVQFIYLFIFQLFSLIFKAILPFFNAQL